MVCQWPPWKVLERNGNVYTKCRSELQLGGSMIRFFFVLLDEIRDGNSHDLKCDFHSFLSKKLHTILTSHFYFFVCWLERTDVNQNLNSLHPFEIHVTQWLPWHTPTSLTYLEGGEPRHAMWLLHTRYGQNLRSLWCFIMPLVSCAEKQRNHGRIIHSQVCSQSFLGFSSPFELKAGI